MADTIKQFGEKIHSLIEHTDLSEEDAFECFSQILRNEQSDLQQGAFLAALVAKGETVEEIVGAWRAIDTIDTVHVSLPNPDELCENSGTGMDQQKTFNASSAAAIVAAACGVTMARHGARALTSPCGTVDILETVGVDVECPISVVEQSIQQTGIGLFNGMSAHVHPGALGRILSQIRFGSTLNIAASLANPARPRLAVRGVYHENLIDPVCDVMSRIGYTNAMIVAGKNEVSGKFMDEISICGPTQILHIINTIRKRSIFEPEEAGIPRASISDIAFTGDLQSEALRFVSVLAGKRFSPCIDFTCINAAAILVVANKCKSLAEGYGVCRTAIETGSALEKLREWVCIQDTSKNGIGKSILEKLMSRI